MSVHGEGEIQVIYSLLPPFYEKPPYENANIYLERIEKEFSVLIERYAYLKDGFNEMWDWATSRLGIIDFTDLLIGDPAKDFEVFFDYGCDFAEMAYGLYTGPKDGTFR